MYQPLIKFHPYPAIITQVLSIFVDRIRGAEYLHSGLYFKENNYGTEVYARVDN